MATKTLWKVLLTGGAGEAFRIDDASGDTKVYIDGNEITELSGVTATAAELNILDGCTATVLRAKQLY
jgi:hypothetical protein